jgi:hypothetical protein
VGRHPASRRTVAEDGAHQLGLVLLADLCQIPASSERTAGARRWPVAQRRRLRQSCCGSLISFDELAGLECAAGADERDQVWG